MKYRWMAAVLALALLLPAAAAGAQFYDEMPALLRFSQETTTWTTQDGANIQQTYPDTASSVVDDEMRCLIDEMTHKNLPKMAEGDDQTLNVGAVVSRSAESALSFLTLAEITQDKRMLSVDFDARVYDVSAHKRITLTDLFGQESEAWTLLSREIRDTIGAAFPMRAPQQDALDALCSREAIEGAAFTLGAARLTLTYRADAVYPGETGLLHVNIGYSRLREMMTPYGQRLTDNSKFRMAALTFDDGPARASTRCVLDVLREHGAKATFFVVGDRFDNNHDMLLREQNANHSIQSHTFTHRYPDAMKKGEAQNERERMEAALGAVIGVVPTMMRAPGGHAAYYARLGIGYPLIQWNLASGDSGNPHIAKIAEKVIGSAGDGDVILLHDLNGGSPQYTEKILTALTDRGFLFVTVEELFEDMGVAPQANVIYYNPVDIREK